MALVNRVLRSASLRSTRLASALLLLALLAQSSLVAAQDDEQDSFSLDDSEESETPKKKVPAAKKVRPAPGPERETLLGDEQALEEERAPEERFRETTDPYEDPKKRYIFLGGGWRFSRVPAWMLGAYGVEEGPAVGTPASFNGELAFRKNGFQVTAALGFSKLSFKGPFQLKNDVIQDTEWLDAKFKFLNLTTAITWSTSFADWFALEYGLEVGIGFLFGDLTRSEAVKQNGKWSECPAWASQAPRGSILFNPEFPSPTPAEKLYCDPPDGPSSRPPPVSNAADEDGAHYGVTANKGLFNGGVPRAVPILGPRLSLRFKPIHQFVIRVDVPLPSIPFGIVGGVAVQYGF